MGPWPSPGQSRQRLGLLAQNPVPTPQRLNDWLSEPALGTALNLLEMHEKLGRGVHDLELGEASWCGTVCGCASEGRAWFAVRGMWRCSWPCHWTTSTQGA